MPSQVIHLRTRRPVDYGVTPGSSTINRRGSTLLRRFANVVMGAFSEDSLYTVGYSATEAQNANGGLTISGGAGSVGAIINGVTVTGTWVTSDTISAGVAAAAINASVNALVQGFVSSNNLSATVTCATVVAGNTVTIGGETFTAFSGTPANLSSMSTIGVFDCSGSNSATATALARAINTHPAVSMYFTAVPVAAVVRIFAVQFTQASGVFSWPTGPGVLPNTITSSGSTLAVSNNGVTAGPVFSLYALQPGISGNAIMTALSGTGVTVLNAAARLERGTGPTSFINDQAR